MCAVWVENVEALRSLEKHKAIMELCNKIKLIFKIKLGLKHNNSLF